MAANELAIVNRAILNLGDARLLTSTAPDFLAEDIVEVNTPQGLAASTLFAQARQETLRGYPWPWAVKMAALGAGTSGEGEVWESEWKFAYPYPDDCLQVLRFLTVRGANDPFPPRYIIGNHADVKVIFSDLVQDEANIEYIEDVADTTRWTFAFDITLSWRVSAYLAMPVTGDEKKADWALDRWRLFLGYGERMEGNESNPHPTHRDECSYTRARFV